MSIKLCTLLYASVVLMCGLVLCCEDCSTYPQVVCDGINTADRPVIVGHVCGQVCNNPTPYDIEIVVFCADDESDSFNYSYEEEFCEILADVLEYPFTDLTCHHSCLVNTDSVALAIDCYEPITI